MMMTNSNSLESELLGSWRPGSERICSGAASERAAVSHRPGYTAFKLVLTFSLILGALALLPWSRAEAGSGLSMQAAGYMYVSVPLNATDPQFEKATVNLDFKGAGMYVLRLQMAQNTGKTHFRAGAYQRQDWRANKAALRTSTPQTGFRWVTQKPKPAKAKRSASRRATAKSQYLALLSAYERAGSRAAKRAMYPKLIAAYERAQASR